MTTITLPRAVAEQALEAMRCAVPTGKITLYEWAKALSDLDAALAQQAEPGEPVEPVATHRINSWGFCGVCRHDRIPGEGCARQECPDSPQQAEPDAYGYASRLAVAIWEKHYKDIAPQWKPLDDLVGVLTQIDNMVAGMTRLAQQAEPVAWVRLEAWKSGKDWPDDCFTALPAEGLTPVYTAPPQQAEPVNVAGPAHLAPKPAPGLEFDERGVLGPQQAEPVEPVAGVVLNEEGRAALVEHGREEWHCAARNARRLYTAPPKDEPKPMHPELRKMWEDYFDKCFRAMPVPEQAEPVEPVAWAFRYRDGTYHDPSVTEHSAGMAPLYTAPPKLVPLTDEEIVRIRMSMPHSVPSPDQHPYDWAVRYARAVERALEEKNRGR